MKIDTQTSAVITGGASGLGEATARAWTTKGARGAIFDVAEQRGEEVARDIGGIFCRVDVTAESSVDEGFARARSAHGQER
ncbi:MAG: SDR family NAD(P)-dependent oxidoreductase, partial [Cyanobium sp.]